MSRLTQAFNPRQGRDERGRIRHYRVRVGRIDPEYPFEDSYCTSYNIQAPNQTDAEFEAIKRYKKDLGGNNPDQFHWNAHTLYED